MREGMADTQRTGVGPLGKVPGQLPCKTTLITATPGMVLPTLPILTNHDMRQPNHFGWLCRSIMEIPGLVLPTLPILANPEHAPAQPLVVVLPEHNGTFSYAVVNYSIANNLHNIRWLF